MILGIAWIFQPDEIRIPAGSEVTFIMTSTDVIHGFNIEGTIVNAHADPPPWADHPGSRTRSGPRVEHLIICTKYCGIQHHTMYGKVIVE